MYYFRSQSDISVNDNLSNLISSNFEHFAKLLRIVDTMPYLHTKFMRKDDAICGVVKVVLQVSVYPSTYNGKHLVTRIRKLSFWILNIRI